MRASNTRRRSHTFSRSGRLCRGRRDRACAGNLGGGGTAADGREVVLWSVIAPRFECLRHVESCDVAAVAEHVTDTSLDCLS
jgi:hypothetical protein